MSNLYIGIMSGTSANAVDVILADFSSQFPQLIATHAEPINKTLQQAIHAFSNPGFDELSRLAEIDVAIAQLSVQAINQILQKSSLKANRIQAIGSHGQTLRHQPKGKIQYTLQVGDANIIAALTGIPTIADFRRKDLALGGQGAPLTPGFHQHIFASHHSSRVILNLGGIGNISVLPTATQPKLLGFDTGPANTLLDQWCQLHFNQPYDNYGEWASQGMIHQELLTLLLKDSYFKKSPPKSIGLEYFSLRWLQQHLQQFTEINPIDVQATLTELTAHSVSLAINQYSPSGEIIICGGGAYNHFLISRLTQHCPNHTLNSSKIYGIGPEWVEATAFAWLAKQTIERKPGNLPSVTGAKARAILGAIYLP